MQINKAPYNNIKLLPGQPGKPATSMERGFLELPTTRIKYSIKYIELNTVSDATWAAVARQNFWTKRKWSDLDASFGQLFVTLAS